MIILLAFGVFLVVGVGYAAFAWYDGTTWAATRRWRAINRARPKECKCGAPGTVWRHIRSDGVTTRCGCGTHVGATDWAT